jgi:hypothetical protein
MGTSVGTTTSGSVQVAGVEVLILTDHTHTHEAQMNDPGCQVARLAVRQLRPWACPGRE